MKKNAPRAYLGPKAILEATTDPPRPSKCDENLVHIDVFVRRHYRQFCPKTGRPGLPKVTFWRSCCHPETSFGSLWLPEGTPKQCFSGLENSTEFYSDGWDAKGGHFQ